ncbi:uncharacterized protein LOC135686224 isoform X1 [Rhopilema esculentum]|uniref:uncharacterized protein LOC135686224 isoform X1 n=1 Tax=Rhopilema esculentum TaxID=499914 RepID=UPI0031D78BF7
MVIGKFSTEPPPPDFFIKSPLAATVLATVVVLLRSDPKLQRVHVRIHWILLRNRRDNSGKLNRNTFKRVSKREADYCKSLIRNYESRKVASCIPFGLVSPFCNGEECPNKPSPPAELHVSEYFLNETTKRPQLAITWKKPLFGLNNLCGYQIVVASLTNGLQTICIQLNSKDRVSYAFDNVLFGGKYNITLISLPAFKSVGKSSLYKVIQIPDKCQVFKDAKEKLPWDCNLPSYLNTTGCVNGSIQIQFPRIDNVEISEYHLMIIPDNRRNPSIYQKSFNGETENATVSELVEGFKYFAMVFYTNRNKEESQRHSSIDFTCPGELPRVRVTECKNGTVYASWERIKFRKSLQYNPYVRAVPYNLHWSRLVKILRQEKDSFKVSGLRTDTSYTFEVHVILRFRKNSLAIMTSVPFSCKGALKKTQQGGGGQPVGTFGILAIVCVLLVVLIIACLIWFARRNSWRLRLKICQRAKRNVLLSEAQSSGSDEQAQTVLLVYPEGCECIEQFVVLLGNFIHNIGIRCILDVVKETEVAKHGGRDLFVMDYLIEANYIIFINYKDTNEVSQHALQCHEKTIHNCIFAKDIDGTTVIPILFEEDKMIGTLKPLYFNEKNVKEQMDTLARKLLNVPTTEFAPELPLQNKVKQQTSALKAINMCVSNIKRKQHLCCPRTKCLRGNKKN